MMEQTIVRLRPLFAPENIFVITTSDFAPRIAKLLPKLPRANIVAEPVGRDTAAAVALGATLVQTRAPQGVMVVAPADHLISDEKKFLQILRDSSELAAKNPLLITLGVRPTEPSPSYGYIQLGAELPLGKKTKFFRVKRFMEKPDEDRARGFVASGEFRWNAGIFVWSVTSIAQALADFTPELYQASERWSKAIGKKNFDKILRREYASLKPVSVDRAILERAVNVLAAEAEIGWEDLGSWAAYWRHLPRDEQGNATVGNVVGVDSRDCLVLGGKKLIATAGLSGVMIVETDDAILVTHKRQAHKVKSLTRKLAENAAYKKLV